MHIRHDAPEDLARIVRAHGAVLLRDPARRVAEFARLAQRLGAVRGDISCSAGPRTEVCPGVFTANEAPPHKAIPVHHEMAQCETPPEFVLFHCEVPPTEGGCTPHIRSSKVVAELVRRFPEVAQRLRSEGVRYRRVSPARTTDASPVGKSWRQRYQADSREEVARACAREGTTCEWMPDDSLRTVGPVVFPLVQGDTSPTLFIAAESSFVTEADAHATKEVVHADGTALHPEVRRAFLHVAEYASRESHRFEWAAGDVLILDNRTVMHARDPFTPPRRILVSLVGSIPNPSFPSAFPDSLGNASPVSKNEGLQPVLPGRGGV